MSTLDERDTLATQPLFLRRTKSGIVRFAQTVLAEGAITNHTLRAATAVKVLADPVGWAQTFALAIVHDGTIELTAPYGNGVTEAQMDGAIQAAWNPLSGVGA